MNADDQSRLACAALEELQHADGDNEFQHLQADQILCGLLVALGFAEVVKAWDRVPKWYA